MTELSKFLHHCWNGDRLYRDVDWDRLGVELAIATVTLLLFFFLLGLVCGLGM